MTTLSWMFEVRCQLPFPVSRPSQSSTSRSPSRPLSPRIATAHGWLTWATRTSPSARSISRTRSSRSRPNGRAPTMFISASPGPNESATISPSGTSFAAIRQSQPSTSRSSAGFRPRTTASPWSLRSATRFPRQSSFAPSSRARFTRAKGFSTAMTPNPSLGAPPTTTENSFLSPMLTITGTGQ